MKTVARSKDCKHSYLNWGTGTVHCHKEKGRLCQTKNCKRYEKEEEENEQIFCENCN